MSKSAAKLTVALSTAVMLTMPVTAFAAELPEEQDSAPTEEIQSNSEENTNQTENEGTFNEQEAEPQSENDALQQKAAQPGNIIKDMTIDKKAAYYRNDGSLWYETTDGYAKVENATWNNDSTTLEMNGAIITNLVANFNNLLTIILGDGTNNTFIGRSDPDNGGQALDAEKVIITGKGNLTCRNSVDTNVVSAGDLTIDGGARVNIENKEDKKGTSLSLCANKVKINDGALSSDHEIEVRENVEVNEKGSLLIDTTASMACISCNGEPGGSFTQNGGNVQLINRYPLDGTGINGYGIRLTDYIEINGGTLTIDTPGNSLAIENEENGKIMINGGIVNATSHYDQAVYAADKQSGSLIITGGDVNLVGNNTCAVGVNHFVMTGGKLHVSVTNPNDTADAIVAYDSITLGDNVAVTNPALAKPGFLGYYMTFVTEDGKAITDITIKEKAPEPNPTPTPQPNNDALGSPVTGDSSTGNVAGAGIIAAIAGAVMSIARRRRA